MTQTACRRPAALPRSADYLNEENTKSLLKSHKLSDDEYQTMTRVLERQPTFTELGIFSSMWSEHCSYKSSRAHLGRFWTENEHVVVGPGENAGVIRIEGNLCAAFKMESHNHPSYLAPYQGASTGVGGIMRDVFCMGARPIANLNALRFGDLNHPKTQYLVDEAVKGIGDYGNCMGVATVGGSLKFHPSYNGNCLVNAMTVGLIDERKIFKGYASGHGNYIVYVGSATGRDGVHGATMASDSFSASDDSNDRSAIQVGDPFMEKLLLEATLEALQKNLIVGLQDMGAAGLTSSSFEMASRAGSGLFMDLDRIPKRTSGLSAYELLLSESQERMLMVIQPKHWEELSEIFERWNLSYAVVGEVTDGHSVEIVHDGKLEASIPVDPITELAPKYNRPMSPSIPTSNRTPLILDSEIQIFSKTAKLKEFIKSELSESGQGYAHIKTVTEQYDRHIGNRTVFNSDHGGAAILWLRDSEDFGGPKPGNLGLSVVAGCSEALCAVDSKLGSSWTLLKLYQSMAAAGAKPIAVTDCLNFGNPENPDVMRSFSESVDGITEACKELSTPVVSGNVSLYNDTDGEAVLPTPMLGLVGKIKNVDYARPASLVDPKPNSKLVWIGFESKHCNFSGQHVANFLGHRIESTQQLPNIDWENERTLANYLIDADLPASACREVGVGGILISSLKMLKTLDRLSQYEVGISFNAESLPIDQWFQECLGGYVLNIEDSAKLVNLPEEVTMKTIATLTSEKGIATFDSHTIDLNA